MSIVKYIYELSVNASMYFLLFLVSLLTIHCFVDERLEVTRKKMITAAAAAIGAELFSLLKLTGADIPFTVLGFLSKEAVFTVLIIWRSIGVRNNIKRIMLFYFTQFMYLMSSSIIIEMLSYGILPKGVLGMDLDNLSFGAEVSFDISMLLIVFAAFLYIYKSVYKKGIAMRPRSSDVVMTGTYCIYILMMIIIFVSMEEEGIALVAEYAFLRGIFSFVMTAVAVVMPYFIVRSRLSAYYSDLSDYQQSFLDAQINASRQYREAQEETRAFRHDVQNELTVISMLMKEGRYSEAEQCVHDMLSEVNALSPRIVTGDDMLDPLISSKLAGFEDMSVTLGVDGVLEGGLNWKPMDKCRVFANALDNAFEACMKLEDADVRHISLTFKKTKHQRFVTMTNPCTEAVDCNALMSGAKVTSKPDKHLHGYGIQIIKRTVEKYGGMVRLSCENGQFTLEIILMEE